MNDELIDTVWLECPSCRWRREYPQSTLSGSMICRKCGSTVLLSASAVEPAFPPDDVLTLESVDLPPASGVNEVITIEPELQFQLRPATSTAPPTDIASQVLPGSAPVETENDAVVRPPRDAGIGWAFTSNVLLFPWTASAVAKWFWASLFSICAVFICAMTAPTVMRGLSTNSLAAPFLIVLAILLLFLSLSYLCACLFDITVNAAYNCDLATDWPEPEIKERFWLFLRIAYLAVMASMPAALIAGLVTLATVAFWPVYAAVIFFLFPVFLLAALETDSSVTPISRPIFNSLLVVWKGWLAFYFLSALMFTALCGVAYFTLANWGPKGSLVVGPLGAAVVFVYGRLLGRLAWLILSDEKMVNADAPRSHGQSIKRRGGRRRDRRAQQLFRGLP